MRASEKEKLEEAAVTGVGAGVGGAGGATVGVLELAATQGTVTGLSAGVVIGAEADRDDDLVDGLAVDGQRSVDRGHLRAVAADDGFDVVAEPAQVGAGETRGGDNSHDMLLLENGTVELAAAARPPFDCRDQQGDRDGEDPFTRRTSHSNGIGDYEGAD